MTRVECPFEDDVLMYVHTGRWPDRVPAELVAHAATCDVCADLAFVAHALDTDRGADRASVATPSAGTMWWRAQLRARQEAATTAGRPITAVQAALLAVCGGVAGAVFGATTGWFQRALHAIAEVVRATTAGVHLPQFSASSADAASLAAGYGATLAIMGIGVAVAIAVVVWAFREG
jgi:hypothetical protein